MVQLTRLMDGTDPGKFRADVNSAENTEISLNGLPNGAPVKVDVNEIAKLDSGGEILPGGDFDNA
ncbi:MAG: hypothetical protein LBN96_05675, partial [Desulfovibrio sp.]|nr:hypothetical protein [Desulfovibrio sp.]